MRIPATTNGTYVVTYESSPSVLGLRRYAAAPNKKGHFVFLYKLYIAMLHRNITIRMQANVDVDTYGNHMATELLQIVCEGPASGCSLTS